LGKKRKNFWEKRKKEKLRDRKSDPREFPLINYSIIFQMEQCRFSHYFPNGAMPVNYCEINHPYGQLLPRYKPSFEHLMPDLIHCKAIVTTPS
jgi:hypothetical protein